MNKKTIKIAGWALGLSMAVAGIGVAAGVSYVAGGNEPMMANASLATEETLSCTAGSISNNTMSFSTASFNIVHAKGSSQNFASYSPWRVYQNNTVTISSKDGKTKIGKIEIVHNSTNYGSLSSSSGTWTMANTSGGTSEWTISEAAAPTSVTITTASQSRWSSIKIYAVIASTEFTVTYNGNGSTGGSVPTDGTTYTSSNNSVTVLDNIGNLVKANDTPAFNYRFDGWNTEPDGSGATYAAGASFTISADTTLYAIWSDPRTVVTLSAEDVNVYVGGSDVTPVISSSPAGHTAGYTLTSASTGKVSIVDGKLHAVAKGDSEITVHIDDDSEYRYVDATFIATARTSMGAEGVGTIEFGTEKVKIDDAEVTGEDDKDNEWTITTAGTTSFTASQSYYQVGSGNKPATSITFTTTLPEEYKITNMTASFGGFSGTEGTVTMKVGDTTVGTGSLSGTSDVSVEQSDSATGNALTVTVTGIAKGVKVYGISYSYLKEVHVTGVELNSSSVELIPNATHQLTATVLPANATDKSVSYATSDDSVATVSKTGLITAVGDGDATITVTSTDGGKTATCTVHVETPAEAYVTIAPTAMGIVDGDYVELDISYGGAFSGKLSAVPSNENVDVVLDDNGDGTGTVTISFENAGTSVISFKDGNTPIEGAGSTCAVTILEKLQAINAKETIISDLTFAQSYGEGGATASDNASWTVTSDADESNFDSGRGIHYGTKNAQVGYVQLATSGISGAVTKVIVNATDAQSASAVSVTVGGKSFACAGSNNVASSSADYVFTGVGNGEIVVRVARPSAQTTAIYVKSVKVTYLSSESTNIANTDVAVQKEVFDFVGTMNTDLSVCDPAKTLSASVWSGLAGKFEIALAKSEDADLFGSMFQFVDSTPRDAEGNADTGDSLQNAVARYDYIIEKYGTGDYEDFLGRVESAKVVPATQGANLWNVSVSNDQNSAFAIAAVLGTGVLAAGGFAFLRRKKKDR